MADSAATLAAIRAASTSRFGPDVSADKSTGIVGADPATLASQAGVSLDVYALGRMVASEVGSGSPEELLGCAECAVNQAKRGGRSVSALLLLGKSSAGKFGQQGTGKWASTARPATARSIVAAQGALAGSSFTSGARDFFDPGGQVVGSTQGVSKITKGSEQYIKDNAAAGLVWVGPLPGVDAGRLMMFRDAKSKQEVATKVEEAGSILNMGSIVAFLFLVGSVLAVAIVAGKGSLHVV